MTRLRFAAVLGLLASGLLTGAAAAEGTALSIRLEAAQVHPSTQDDFISLPELEALVAARAEAEGLTFSELQARKAAMALWKTLTFNRDNEPPAFQLPYEGISYCVSWPEDGQEDPCE